MNIQRLLNLNNVYMEGEGDPTPPGGGDPTPPGGPGDPPPSDPPPSDPPPSDPPAAPFYEAMPDDWRSQVVASTGMEPGEEFDKRVAQLERVSDMGTLGKNYFAAQDRIRNGEISNGLPEDPTDEAMGEYRKKYGIPSEASGYDVSLDEGLVLGEGDTRIMGGEGGVYEMAHKHNVSSEAMNDLTNAMLKGRATEAQARINQDGIDTQTGDRQLQDLWQGDFEANKNLIRGLITQLPESVSEAFSNARMPDGKAIFNSPEIMVAMADWARKINPSATVVPNSNNPMQTMTDEIAKLEGMMGEPGWHKDQASQKRLMDLYQAQEDMKAQQK